LYIIASSQLIQFHQDNIGDSGTIVTPFMQDGTYPPRNFATLGPSELQPPFTGIYNQTWFDISFCSTGQESDFIRLLKNLQSPVFLINSRRPLFNDTLKIKFKSVPSSEVTKRFCRVPSILFSRCFSLFNLSTSVSFNTINF